MTPKKIRATDLTTAYHEAGHAVADWCFGSKIKRVTIVPKGDVAGSVSSVSRLTRTLKTLEYTKLTGAQIGRCHELIVEFFVGRAAQRRFKPGSCRAFHSASDLDTVSRLLIRLHPEPEERKHVFRYLEARARNFVSHSRNWLMIQDLAKTLVERRTMSGQEAEATLRTSMAAQLAEAQAKRKKGRVATAHR